MSFWDWFEIRFNWEMSGALLSLICVAIVVAICVVYILYKIVKERIAEICESIKEFIHRLKKGGEL